MKSITEERLVGLYVEIETIKNKTIEEVNNYKEYPPFLLENRITKRIEIEQLLHKTSILNHVYMLILKALIEDPYQKSISICCNDDSKEDIRVIMEQPLEVVKLLKKHGFSAMYAYQGDDELHIYTIYV